MFEFSKLILELTIFVVVRPWEIGESCLTLDNEVIMSNLGATAATFQNNHGISSFPYTPCVTVKLIQSHSFTFLFLRSFKIKT